MTLNRASLKTFANTFSNCIVIISSDAVQPRTCLLFFLFLFPPTSVVLRWFSLPRTWWPNPGCSGHF